MILFKDIKEFKKELKRLNKKYKSLPKDLEIFKKVLNIFPEGNSKRNFNLLNQTNNIKYIKARLRSSDSKKMLFRIVYVYFKGNLKEQDKIVFIELFSKSEKQNHDIKRIDNIKKEVQNGTFDY